jgi:periplasmic protein TonB
MSGTRVSRCMTHRVPEPPVPRPPGDPLPPPDPVPPDEPGDPPDPIPAPLPPGEPPWLVGDPSPLRRLDT